MIIDHNRSLPKSGSPHLSTPNKSPSPLPHKPTPQQTAKSQQVHTHQSDESTTDTIKTETTPSDPLLAMVHRSINTSDDDVSDISNVLSVKRSCQIQVFQHYLFQHTNHFNQQLVVTEFRQPLQVQSHLEMPRILVQLGHIQRT